MDEAYGQENWQTALNYNPRVRATFALIVSGLASLPAFVMDRGKPGMALPPILRGHIFDAFGGFYYATLNKE